MLAKAKSPFRRLESLAASCFLIFRCFYVLNLLAALRSVLAWPWRVNEPLPTCMNWLNCFLFDFLPTVTLAISPANFVSALLVTIWPEKRGLRVLACATFLVDLAVTAAYDRFYKTELMLPFVLAILALMPFSGRRGRRDQVVLIFGFVACQAQVLLIHSLAGFWKIVYGLTQAIQGEIGDFHPLALPLHVLHRLETFERPHPFGAWLIGNSQYFFPLFLALIALQTVSLAAVFRAHWQRAVGVLLILFHAVTTIALAMSFTSTVALLALFLVLSPFAKTEKGAGTNSFRRLLKRALR